MKRSARRLARAALALVIGLAAAAAGEIPTPERLDPDVWLIRGGHLPSRQPNGNTVVLQAPAGLIVVDTGRHGWHRTAILRLAEDLGSPVAVIVNTHWHLDHVSGNPVLKQVHPGARAYASDAIEGALAGFLPRSAADGRRRLQQGGLPVGVVDDIQGDVATIETGAALRPDEVIASSAHRTLAGRPLHVHLAKNAATAGDVWLYDPATRLAVVGDLVTLPAPFLDTACPQGWRNALAAVWATPFERLVPGHGPVLSRADVAAYRRAFDTFIACAASSRTTCAAGWVEDAGALIPSNDRAHARAMADYYVRLLRTNGGKSASCEAA